MADTHTADQDSLPDYLDQKQISALFKKGPDWFRKNRARLIEQGFPKPKDWPGRKVWDREAVEIWLASDEQEASDE